MSMTMNLSTPQKASRPSKRAKLENGYSPFPQNDLLMSGGGGGAPLVGQIDHSLRSPPGSAVHGYHHGTSMMTGCGADMRLWILSHVVTMMLARYAGC